jgi:hypothetical protein
MIVHFMLFALFHWLQSIWIKSEFKFRVQIQNPFDFVSFFPLPLFFFGPSPAGHLSPLLPFLFLLLQAAHSPSPLPSFLSPARSPPTSGPFPRARPSFPSLFFPPARAWPASLSPGPLARPLFRAPSPSSFCLAGPTCRASPSPRPTGTRVRVRHASEIFAPPCSPSGPHVQALRGAPT